MILDKLTFEDIFPGERFYVVAEKSNDDIQEHLRLANPTDDWNCVNLENGLLGHICDDQSVWVKNGGNA